MHLDQPRAAGQTSAPVRVALIGAGGIALGAHVPALLAHPEIELTVIVEPDPSAQRRAVVELGNRAPRIVDDLDAILGEGNVDACVIATQPWVTPALVERALRAGFFVLAEKPIAVNSKAAASLAALSDEERARFQIGFTYRHHEAFDRLRELIVDGRFGEPLLVRIAVYNASDPENRVRLMEVLRHGSPILHEGAHIADWLHVILGRTDFEIEHGWMLQTLDELPSGNLCGASLRHPAGHRVLLEVGWLLPTVPKSVISVFGPGACAELDVYSFELRVSDSHGTEHYAATEDRATRCFARQVDSFVALCRGDGARSPTLDDALASLRLTDQLAECMLEGR
jgi:myo-inositol 2-dehydrogenase / D-chiro-inositol 1-dehydrogenase